MSSEIIKSTSTRVNWNAGKFLEATVNSLREQTRDILYEIILFDNNSNKDEKSYLYNIMKWLRNKVHKITWICFVYEKENKIIKDNPELEMIAFKAFGKEPEWSLLNPKKVAEASLKTFLSDITGQVIDVRRNDN